MKKSLKIYFDPILSLTPSPPCSFPPPYLSKTSFWLSLSKEKKKPPEMKIKTNKGQQHQKKVKQKTKWQQQNLNPNQRRAFSLRRFKGSEQACGEMVIGHEDANEDYKMPQLLSKWPAGKGLGLSVEWVHSQLTMMWIPSPANQKINSSWWAQWGCRSDPPTLQVKMMLPWGLRAKTSASGVPRTRFFQLP